MNAKDLPGDCESYRILRLQPDDVVVIMPAEGEVWDSWQAEGLRRHLRETFPEARDFIVMCDGTRLGVTEKGNLADLEECALVSNTDTKPRHVLNSELRRRNRGRP